MANRWGELFDDVFERVFEDNGMGIQREPLKPRAAAARPILAETLQGGRARRRRAGETEAEYDDLRGTGSRHRE